MVLQFQWLEWICFGKLQNEISFVNAFNITNETHETQILQSLLKESKAKSMHRTLNREMHD